MVVLAAVIALVVNIVTSGAIGILTGVLAFGIVMAKVGIINWASHILGIANAKFSRALALGGTMSVIGFVLAFVGGILFVPLSTNLLPLFVVIAMIFLVAYIMLWLLLAKKIYGFDWKKAVSVMGVAHILWVFIWIVVGFIVFFVSSFFINSYGQFGRSYDPFSAGFDYGDYHEDYDELSAAELELMGDFGDLFGDFGDLIEESGETENLSAEERALLESFGGVFDSAGNLMDYDATSLPD